MPLNDARIRTLRPQERPYKVADGGGLYLEVKPSGSKLWRFRYRLGISKGTGKPAENVYAIGAYPAISLAKARTERDVAKQLVKEGIHPAHKRNLDKIRQANEHANTFRTVAWEWLEHNALKWKPETARQRRNALAADVFPYIGSLPVSQVTPAHVLDILKRIEKKAPVKASFVKQSIGAICRHAITTLRAEIDPTAPLRNILKPHKPEHSQPLTVQEIPGFFKALDEQSFTTAIAFDLLWLTLARSNEIINAEWSEFDIDSALWVIPAHRMKMGEAHRVPLPRQAIKLLRRLHAITGKTDYLFPNRDNRKRPASHTLLRKTTARMGYTGRFSPHGVRSTGSTILNEMGYRAEIIEAQLAHAERNKSRKAYNRADYLEERRDMMQKWADYLDSLKAGGNNIVLLKRGA